MNNEQIEGNVEFVGEAEANQNEVNAIELGTGQVLAIAGPVVTEDDATEEDNGNEAIAVEEVQAGDAVAEPLATDQAAEG